MNDGLDDSNEATVTITVGDDPVLLSDTFDRPDSGVVGNGWLEVEEGDAEVAVVNNRLSFIDTSDRVNRPMVMHSFERRSSGELVWDFEFDWARTGAEGTYRLFMQLGDGALMTDEEQDLGVGVNLVWSNIDGVHETLGYRQGGVVTMLTGLRGTAQVSVVVDLDQYTYEVAVDGVVVQSQIPFDHSVDLDTVRFFTDALNEMHFSGLSFDAVQIKAPSQ